MNKYVAIESSQRIGFWDALKLGKAICYLLGIFVLLGLSSCAYETPIQRYSESRSKFNCPPVLMSNNIPQQDIYRVFEQGATGFVPISALREDLEDRATKFCERQGKGMLVLGEQISYPPFILGNFPRVEIVFAAVNKH